MTLLRNEGLNVGWKHKGECGCVEGVDNIGSRWCLHWQFVCQVIVAAGLIL